ncbi:ATP-dependent Clp protease proteolytic subunit, partial [Serinicoccus chungangensis]
ADDLPTSGSHTHSPNPTTPRDSYFANAIIAQLIQLESATQTSRSSSCINSPGGSIPAMLAIYDAMQFVRAATHTTRVGLEPSTTCLQDSQPQRPDLHKQPGKGLRAVSCSIRASWLASPGSPWPLHRRSAAGLPPVCRGGESHAPQPRRHSGQRSSLSVTLDSPTNLGRSPSPAVEVGGRRDFARSNGQLESAVDTSPSCR